MNFPLTITLLILITITLSSALPQNHTSTEIPTSNTNSPRSVSESETQPSKFSPNGPAYDFGNGFNNAICIFGPEKWRGLQLKWYVFADGPWADGHWQRETRDKHHHLQPKTYVDTPGERLLDRLHQKCGSVPSYGFKYGNISTGVYNNQIYAGTQGIAEILTYKPTTLHCVEGTIWEISREKGGVVNGGFGAICHYRDDLPDDYGLLWEKAKGLSEKDGCALEQVGEKC